MFFLNASLYASKLISSQEILHLEGNFITAAKTVGVSNGDEVLYGMIISDLSQAKP